MVNAHKLKLRILHLINTILRVAYCVFVDIYSYMQPLWELPCHGSKSVLAENRVLPGRIRV